MPSLAEIHNASFEGFQIIAGRKLIVIINTHISNIRISQNNVEAGKGIYREIKETILQAVKTNLQSV